MSRFVLKTVFLHKNLKTCSGTPQLLDICLYKSFNEFISYTEPLLKFHDICVKQMLTGYKIPQSV